jgi:hypothetical protein
MLQCCGHVTAIRRAYSDSSHFSDQLSCRKLFHPSYGLFYMIFQRLNDFLEYLDLFNSNYPKQCSLMSS